MACEHYLKPLYEYFSVHVPLTIGKIDHHRSGRQECSEQRLPSEVQERIGISPRREKYQVGDQ